MRPWWVVACLAPCACSGLLGLDPTVSADRDRDMDGVDDSIDNCPGLRNPLQLASDCVQGLTCETAGERTSQDGDRDGVDDGCDLCLAGPSLDEDGDGVADACDPCPAAKQSDSDLDGDGIDDTCDPAPMAPQRRLLFDGFDGDHLSVVWNASAGWIVANGRVAIAAGGGTLPVRDLQIAGDADGTWSIELGLDLPATATAGDEIGIDLGFAGAPTRCKLVYQAGWKLHLATKVTDQTAPVAAQDTTTLRASFFRKNLVGPGIVCQLGDGQVLEDLSSSAIGPFIATPYATAAAAFRYVEILGKL